MDATDVLVSKIKTLQFPSGVEMALLDLITKHIKDPVFSTFVGHLLEWGVQSKENEIKAAAYDYLKETIDEYESKLQILIEQWHQQK